MKNILFVITILLGTYSFAQQEITPSQQELSKRTHARVQKFNEKIDTKVDAIMTTTQLDIKQRGELREIVGTTEALLVRLDREGTDTTDYQGRRNDIMNNYQTQMKQFLGKEKFELLQKEVSPK